MIGTKRTTELVAGDIVQNHGMILRVETDPTPTPDGAVATDALVLNVDEVQREGLVPMSWLEREDGSKRWTIKGNDLATWYVVNARDILFVVPAPDGNGFRILDGDGRDFGTETDREDADALKRYLSALRRRIFALVQRSNAGDTDATEILFEIVREGDPDEIRVLSDFRDEAREIVAKGIGCPEDRLPITAYGVANALGLAHGAKIAKSFGTGTTYRVLQDVATERRALDILFPGALDKDDPSSVPNGYDDGVSRAVCPREAGDSVALANGLRVAVVLSGALEAKRAERKS